MVPLTGHTERVFPFQVLLPTDETGLARESKAEAEQVRSIAAERIGSLAGRVPPELMAQLDEALRLHMQL